MERKYSNAPQLSSGMAFCAGCGIPLVLNPVLQAAHDVGVIPVVNVGSGCGVVGLHIYPHSGMKDPMIHIVFETSAAGGSGVRAAINAQVKAGKIPEGTFYPLVFSGDGSTTDIGIASLSGMLARGEKVFYVCYDNAFYANTGCQYSSMTPDGAHTTTTPHGSMPTDSYGGKDMIALARAHPAVRYIAMTTISTRWNHDIREKARAGFTAGGPAYMHVIQPCPRGWGVHSSSTVEIADTGIDCGVIPLLHIVREGEPGGYDHNLYLDFIPERYEGGILHPEVHPVTEWYEAQGRFKFVANDKEWLAKMQRTTDHKWLGKHGLILSAEAYGK